jgi:aspartyl-tRNA(Asn)/glutamyl-tRNA(Gln) amidotransferase subunit C
MSVRIDRGEVERIAALAHLELDPAASDRLTADMAAMLEYAARVLAVDTSGVAPTSHPLGLDPALRDDTPVPSIDRAAVLASAPDADAAAGLFRVPRVLPRDE